MTRKLVTALTAVFERKRTIMKNYGAMRFVAGVLKVLGWIIVALGILIFIAAILGHQNVPSSPYVNPATVAFVAFLVAGSIVYQEFLPSQPENSSLR